MEVCNVSVNKITFEDGLYLDGTRIKGITKYDLVGDVDEVTILKLELIVDDSELFKVIEHEFKPLAD